MKETYIQQAIVKAVRAVLPPEWRLFSIPNEGRRSFKTGARMKAEGMVSGVHDLCLLGPDGITFWIEVKAPKGRLSKNQKEWHEWTSRNSIPSCTVTSVDGTLKEVKKFLAKNGTDISA